jgi:hypothetical protein
MPHINVVGQGSCSSQAFAMPHQLRNELVKREESVKIYFNRFFVFLIIQSLTDCCCC